MKQTITLIALLCFTCFNFLHAQDVSLILSDEEVSCDVNEVVTIEFSVEDFNDIAGIQGTIVFDSVELQVDDLRDFFPGGIFVPNINNDDGFITFSWFRPTGQNLPDGTVVMEIDFIVSNPGIVATHHVEFSNVPTPMEVTKILAGLPTSVPFITEDGSIAIVDEVDPTVNCPDDVDVEVALGETGDVVNNIGPDADDDCGIETLTYNISGATVGSGDDDASGTFFNLGESSVEYTVSDFGGNSASCSFTVTVSEAVPPPPGQLSLELISTEASCNDEGTFFVNVDGLEDAETLSFSIEFDASVLTYLSADNLIGGDFVIDDSQAGSGLLGFTFENEDGYTEDVGTSILSITFGTGDDLGTFDVDFGDVPVAISGFNTDGIDFDISTSAGEITIFDSENPFIECPANVTVDAESGETTAVVNDIEPTDSGDNCGVEGISYNLSGATNGSGVDDASGTEFNGGVTTVTYTATDFAGNESECSFSVTVNVDIPVSDTITLVITSGVADCGNEVTLEVEVFNFNDVRGVQFSINWDSDNFSYVSSSADFPGGSPLVNNGDDFLSFSGFAGSDVSLPNGHAILTFTLAAFGAEGDAGVVFSDLPLAVEITNLDGNLPFATIDGSVEISDTEDPEISCPSNVTEEGPFGSTSVQVFDIEPADISDDCGVDNVTYTLSGATSGSGDDDASGESFNIGVTTVTYVVNDLNGNNAECSFEVTVEEALAGDDIVIYVQDYVVDCNQDQVVVSVRLQNFEDVLGIQYSVNWDENALDFVSASIVIPNGTGDINEDFVDEGKLATSWASASAPAISNGDAILEITFNILSASGVSSAIEITDDPVAIEFSNLDGQLPFEAINGSFLYLDNDDPTAECPDDVLVFVDNLGDPSVEVDNIEVSADDNCEVVSVTYDVSGATTASGDDDASGTEFNLGVSTVTYTVTDNAGNTAECSFTVEVKPVVSDLVTLYVGDADPSCDDIFTVDITADDFIGIGGAQFTVAWDADVIEFIDFESFFPNGQSQANDSLVVDGLLLFSWAGTSDVVFPDGFVIITLTFQAIGDIGESTSVDIVDDPLDIEFSSLDFLVNNIPYEVFGGVVNIIDEIAPEAVCEDITVELDANGDAAITADDVDGGSSDNCGVISLGIDVNSFDCSDVGDNTVTLTVTDPSGNESTCEATVTVEDNIAPTALCQDATVELDENGTGSISAEDIDNGSFDNCGVESLELDITSFGCADVGDLTVTLTVTDENGNESTCQATVTVEDNIAPTAICQDAVVELDENGEGSITAEDIDNGSFDNCDIASLELDVTDFDCDNVGSNSVTLTVTDENGNVSSCVANVEVEDNIAPVLVCVDSTEVFLDENGEASLDLDDVVISATDNCEVSELFANVAEYDCSLVGGHDLFITASDPSGNETTCDFHLTVIDDIAPVLVCVDSFEVFLDENGEASLDLDDVVISATDNCEVVDLFANVSEYDCSLVGGHDLFITAVDPSGNESTCDFHLTVTDAIAPVLVCVDSVEVFLDENGEASLDLDDVVISATDNCEVVDLFANVAEYDCSLVGGHDLFVTAVDPSGNEGTCDFHLTVIDAIAPELVCVDSVEVFLDENGEASLDLDEVVISATDNCEVSELFANVSEYNCDLVGGHDLFITAADPSGNETTCDFHLTVTDNIAPELVCVDSIEIILDVEGFATLETEDVIITATDNCEVSDLELSVSEFNCTLVGVHTLTLTASDPSGNSATCEFTAIIIDDLAPTLECVDSLTIALDSSGFASLDLDDVITSIMTACGADTLFANVSEYDCSLVGEHDLFVTAIDPSGNASTCDFHLTIIDDIAPVLVCVDSLTIALDSNGLATLDLSDVVTEVSDACGIEELFANVADYDCDLVGEHDLFVTAIDSNGNETTCDFHLTVIDDLPPVLVCVDEIDIYLNEEGEASVDPLDLVLSVSDNCGVEGVIAEPITFDCGDAGTVSISVEASDVNGNISSCEITANVLDTIPPTLICNDFTAELDENGQVIVTADDVDGGSFDNCGFASIDPEFVILTCDDIGENVYVGVVTDLSGNTASCEVIVTVEDNLPPTALCVGSFEVELMPPGWTQDLEPSDIDNGSFDNCGDVTLSIEPTSLNALDVGDVDIVLTVTDENGNVSTCVTTVTVLELPPCEITCPDDVVVSNDPGVCGAFIDLPEAILSGFCTAPNFVFTEDFDGCAQPAGWVNTSTSASVNLNAVACFAPGASGNLFSYQCTNGVPFGGVAIPPTFAGCQATIDTDRAGAAAIYRGKHCQVTPAIDLSAGGAQLRFDYQNRPLGAGGIFTAEAWDGSSWNVLFQTNALASNSEQTVSIASYSNSDFQVRFCYDDNGVWAWGSAIDNVQVLALGGSSNPDLVNDFNNGGSNASGFYPIGTTTVTFGIPNTGVECSTTITVEDTEAPVFTNCQDYEFTLLPGECGLFFNFELEATDNCPVSAESVAGPYCDPCFDATGGSALACAPFQQNAIIQFIDLPSAGIMEYFCFNQETFGNAEPATIHFYEPQAPGVVPYIGGGFTPFYSIDYQTVAADDGTCVCVDFPEPVDVPAGGVWVEVWTPGATLNSRVVQTPANCDGSVGTGNNTYLQAPGCGFATPVTFSSIGFFLDASFAIGFSAGDLVGTGDPNAPAGFNEYESGDFLPIGEHCFLYSVEDAAGNTATCEFCVVVNEFPNPTSTMVCNDLINFSLDENCEGLLNADMILEGGPYGCYDNYELVIETINGISVPDPLINSDYIGQTLVVTVLDPFSNNSCWGYVVIEDKLAPNIECRDLVVVCGEMIPEQPAPGVDGPQTIIFEGLTDVVGVPNNPAEIEYEFDFTNLPVDATIEDVDVRIKVQHTWATDMTIQVESPSGTVVSVFNVTGGGGCLASNITIDVTFDDDGIDVGNCTGLNLGGAPLRPMMGGAMHFNGLETFNGEDARGIWTVRFLDNVFGDDGNIEIAGLILEVNAPTIEPSDNCGDLNVSFSDVIEDFGCVGDFSEIITRTWVAEDESGNVSTCDQTISILRVSIEDLVGPPNFDGISGPTLSCGGNWDTNGNGYPDPEETSGFINTCDNIAFTYEDLVFDVCGTGFKILRKWIIFDWCTNEIGEFSQLIKVEDDVAPVFAPNCENDITINTDATQCERLMWFVPVPQFLDDPCVDQVSYTVSSSAGTVVQNNQGAWIIQNIPVGQHTVTYEAVDGCGNVSNCSFTLNVVDNVAPVALCDLDTRVSLGSDGNALVHWTALDDGSYDNCGIAEIGLQRDISNPGGRAGCGNSPGANVWVPQLNFCCDDLDRDPISVIVRVVDINGNVNFCNVHVLVEDKLAPVVACPDPIEVDLNCLFDFDEMDWSAQIGNNNAANVSPAAVRNIEILEDFFGRIARTQSPFNEVARTFEINPTGNPNSTARIQITDGTASDNCPVSDEGLRVFQTYRITVDPHCGNVGTGVSQLNPFKGNLAIERNFYVVDGQGNGSNPPNAGFGNPNTASCTQRIYVTNSNPFQGLTRQQWENNALGQANIVRTINECGGNDPSLDEVGQIDKTRILNYVNNRADAACANILVGYTDMDFQIVQDACFKVLRQWKVIDWCQHDPNTGAGEWTFIQTIKVMDAAGPSCDGCGERDIVITDGIDCTGFVDFEVEFIDGCTPDDQLGIRFQIDAFSTGSFDIDESYVGAANVTRANRVLPFGDHIIRWTVSDMCGNVNTFEYQFSVVDGKLPTPVCINGIATVIMPASDSLCVEINASAYDAGSFDDCTSNENLIFTFSEDTTNTTMEFCCDDLGTNIVEIWVTDEAGNQDYCETYILVQDPNEVCGNQSIAGLLETELNETIGEADVVLTKDGGLFGNATTLDDGLFSFNSLALNSDYVVTPEKDINPLNGVTTYDIALIQRHILGIQYLNSPYKLIAADVRADGVINVLDVADLRSLILGKRTNFVNNTSWKFVSSDQEFPAGMMQPPHPSEIETNRNYDEFASSIRDANFVGVKIGDVNDSNQPNSLVGAESRSFATAVNILIDKVDFNAGDLVKVDFRGSDFNEILGYQFTLNFDNSVLDFQGFEAGILENISENNFGFHLIGEGMITTSWNTSEHVTKAADEVLFTLEFIARQNGSTSDLFGITSAVTASEAYRANEGIVDVNLLIVDEIGLIDADVFALYQNTPNPFNQHTTIGFVVPESVSGTMTIYDVTGKVVKVIEDDFSRGYNQITLTRSDLPANGMYYYQLEAGSYNATKKMMLIE